MEVVLLLLALLVLAGIVGYTRLRGEIREVHRRVDFQQRQQEDRLERVIRAYNEFAKVVADDLGIVLEGGWEFLGHPVMAEPAFDQRTTREVQRKPSSQAEERSKPKRQKVG